jgi:hypothetical protein
MTHKDVYERFKELFPPYAADVTTWFPNGKGSIRVRLKSGLDYVFTVNGRLDWRFETVGSFIKSTLKVKGE